MFYTNETGILLAIARDPSITLSQVARKIGITERAVQRIIGILEEQGVFDRVDRIGRKNAYKFNINAAFVFGDKPIYLCDFLKFNGIDLGDTEYGEYVHGKLVHIQAVRGGPLS